MLQKGADSWNYLDSQKYQKNSIGKTCIRARERASVTVRGEKSPLCKAELLDDEFHANSAIIVL